MSFGHSEAFLNIPNPIVVVRFEVSKHATSKFVVCVTPRGSKLYVQTVQNPVIVVRFKASKPGPLQICRLEHIRCSEMILFARFDGEHRIPSSQRKPLRGVPFNAFRTLLKEQKSHIGNHLQSRDQVSNHRVSWVLADLK